MLVFTGMALANTMYKEDFEDSNIANWVHLHGVYSIRYDLYQSNAEPVTHDGSYFLALKSNLNKSIQNYVGISILQDITTVDLQIHPVYYKDMKNPLDVSMTVLEFTNGFSSTYLIFKEYVNLTKVPYTTIYVNDNGAITNVLLNNTKFLIWDWFDIQYNKKTGLVQVGLNGVGGFHLTNNPTEILIYGFHGYGANKTVNNETIYYTNFEDSSYVLTLDNIEEYTERSNIGISTPIVYLIAGVIGIGIAVAVWGYYSRK